MKSEKQRGCLSTSPAIGKSNPCILVAARVFGASSPSLEGQLLEGCVGDSFTFPEAIYEMCSVLLNYTFQKHFFLRLYIPYNVLFSLITVLEERKVIKGVCIYI